MLTALVAIHCTVAGGFFVFFYLGEKLGGALGAAFGLPGKPTPTWQHVLMSAGWEIYLLAMGASVLKEKYQALKG